MIPTEETLLSFKNQLQTLSWFHPERIQYHIFRLYQRLNNKNTPFIYEILQLKYIFSYCNLFAVYALKYIQIFNIKGTTQSKRTVLLQ